MDPAKRPTTHGLVPGEDAEALYEQAPCGYLSYAPDGTVVKVNETLLSWTGYRREDVVHRLRFVDLLTPGSRIYHETHYAPLLRMQGSVQEIAFMMVRADGGRLPVLVNSRVLTGRDGEESVTLTSVFNATDRRRYEQELMAARRHAEQATARYALMQRMAGELAAARDLAQVREVLCRAGTHALGADACVLWLWGERAGNEAVARPAHLDVGLAPGRALPPEAIAAKDVGLVKGEVVALAGNQVSERFPWATDVLGPGDAGVLALAPLLEHGRLAGVLGCRFDDRDALEPAEVELLGALAGQAALAVPRARLFEQQRDVVETLQRSLLPADLPRDPRFVLATSYRPARGGPAVGGDWYDAFWVDDDRLAIVVGDVVGRGVHAAAAMGQLRSATRALASVAPDPAQVLEGLDHFVDGVPAASCATMVYGVLDASTGRLQYACAGHPPPMLLPVSGAAQVMWEGRSLPLGVRVGKGRRAEARVQLPPGARLVLYTDGLVERRDAPLDVRIDQLAAELRRQTLTAPEQLVESVADAMLQHPQASDDVCLLCLARQL